MAQTSCVPLENGSGSNICQVLTGAGLGTGNVLDALTFPVIILISVLGIVGALVIFIGQILQRTGRG